MIKEVTRILNETVLVVEEAMGLWDPQKTSYDKEYKRISKTLQDGAATVALSTTIRQYLKDSKANRVGRLTRDCLYALADNLVTYSKYASHLKIESGLSNYNDNIFNTTTYGKEALIRTYQHEKTNIRYKDYLRFGAARLEKDLLDCDRHIKIYLGLDSHEPLDYELTIETGHEGMYTLLIPIMPTVILENV